MERGFVPDAVIEEKLEHMRAELFVYIDRNIEAIEQNLPVFFGQVASILEKATVKIPDAAHDEFIDAVVFHLFGGSRRIGDQKFVARVTELAPAIKRNKEKKSGIHVAAAIHLIRAGKYLEASYYLKPYKKHDAKVGTWFAYCYYALYKDGSQEPGYNPGSRWNYAKLSRQAMEDLSTWKPRHNLIVKGILATAKWMEKPFWLMLFSAVEWFPDEQWYLHLGIKIAKEDANGVTLAKLLQIALGRFPGDIVFFREAYFRNFNQGELDAAIELIRDMRQRYPREIEPVYYGLRTSFFMQGTALFTEFRTAAEEVSMPSHVLQIVDFAFEYFKGRQGPAALCLEHFLESYPGFDYFARLLDFIAFHCEDPDQKRAVRLAVFGAVDSYCRRMLQIKEN
ncbi:MAG: hypothetical protein APR53_07430 [Methanoculleus sp. SDB]|nr:MAG: hypothetical protein APR53_07430 [Methanoculleus sp. SDB]